jgi:hypothetical protein
VFLLSLDLEKKEEKTTGKERTKWRKEKKFWNQLMITSTFRLLNIFKM